MLIYRILGGLHLSSIEPINKEVDLKSEYGITHILSIVPGPMNDSYLKDYTWKQIEVTDEESTNLVPYFKGVMNSLIQRYLKILMIKNIKEIS